MKWCETSGGGRTDTRIFHCGNIGVVTPSGHRPLSWGIFAQMLLLSCDPATRLPQRCYDVAGNLPGRDRNVPLASSGRRALPSNSFRTLLRCCWRSLRRRPVCPASPIRLKSISQQPVMASCSGGTIAAARMAHISPFTSGTTRRCCNLGRNATSPFLRRIQRHQWGGMGPRPPLR